jgi:NTP pyrophosphatase (non-canonical NTP hydrolase)
MSERYKPNGTPLTDHERELLVILMEECAEVTQAASKLIRFGKENHPDTGLCNSLVLETEIGDLSAVVSMVEEAGLTSHYAVIVAAQRKRAKLARFMQTDAVTQEKRHD